MLEWSCFGSSHCKFKALNMQTHRAVWRNTCKTVYCRHIWMQLSYSSLEQKLLKFCLFHLFTSVMKGHNKAASSVWHRIKRSWCSSNAGYIQDFTIAIVVYLHGGVHIYMIMDAEILLLHSAWTLELVFDASENVVLKTSYIWRFSSCLRPQPSTHPERQ